MFNFLKEDSKVSTMRVSLFLITIFVCLLIASIAFFIIWSAIYCLTIDFMGLSAFFVAIGAVMTSLLYNKVSQKKVELGAIMNSITGVTKKVTE